MTAASLLDIAVDVKADIRLIFFDVDGTLLNNCGRYSENLRHQLVRVQSLGIKTAIASGRAPFACRFLFDELALLDVGVFLTGAQVYDPLHGRTLRSSPLSTELQSRFLDAVEDLGLYAEVYTEEGFYIAPGSQNDVQAEHARHLRAQPVVQNFRSIPASKPVLKWLLGAEGAQQVKQLKALESVFPELQFAYARFPPYPGWCFANVIDCAADKASAFKQLLQHYKVEPKNVMSFGDSHSDMVFLGLSGWGIAMGNADSQVKEVARAVTASADEDGVALALERLI